MPLNSYQFAVEGLPFNLYHETHIDDVPRSVFLGDRLYIPEVQGLLVDIRHPRMFNFIYDYRYVDETREFFSRRYITYDNRLYFTAQNPLSILHNPFYYFNLIVETIVNLYRDNYAYFYYLNSVMFPGSSFSQIQNNPWYYPFMEYIDLYNFSIFLELSYHRGFYEVIIDLVNLIEHQNNLMNSLRIRYYVSIGASFIITGIILKLSLKKNEAV